MKGVRKSKTNMISAAMEKKQCLLLCQLVMVVLQTVPEGGAFLCSRQIQKGLVCTGKWNRENRMDCNLYGEASSYRYCGVILYTH